MKYSKKIFALCLMAILLVILFVPPIMAQGSGSLAGPGIITPPALHDGLLYFVSFPDMLYAYDEEADTIRWNTQMSPPLDDPLNYDSSSLPAPAPFLTGSMVIVHLGRQIWGISMLDGRPVWTVTGVPMASLEAVSCSGNTMPGYYPISDATNPAILTLEQEDDSWFCRRRRIGDGSLEWEKRIKGEPVGWWLERDKLLVAHERYGPDGPSSHGQMPCSTEKINLDDGSPEWETELVYDNAFRMVLRQPGSSIFLIEKMPNTDFQIRSFHSDTGVLLDNKAYSAGEFISAGTSVDKIVAVHSDGDEEAKQVKALFYHSTLNQIKTQTMPIARQDQLFPFPVIDRNMLLYAGATYSLYDGNLVWEEHIQRSMVDWEADDFHLYVWDSAGFLVGLDRLTGKESWRTPFNVLPPQEDIDSNFGGAALTLLDNRLFATTPNGELIRINPEDGVLDSEFLRVSSDPSDTRPGGWNHENPSRNSGSAWLWITILIVLGLGGFFAWFILRKNTKWGSGHGN